MRITQRQAGEEGFHIDDGEFIYFANVRDDLPPLAFGIRACSAGEMPKVPKAWGLGRSLR